MKDVSGEVHRFIWVWIPIYHLLAVISSYRPYKIRAYLVAQMVKNLPAMQETQVWSLGWEEPLEKGRATHFSTLTWKIPWTEEPGGLQSMGLQRVGHHWTTTTTIIHILAGPGEFHGKMYEMPSTGLGHSGLLEILVALPVFTAWHSRSTYQLEVHIWVSVDSPYPHRP